MLFGKKLFLMGLVCSLSIPSMVSAEGFGINEWSAEGVAMGGARMFAENDPANVAYNPASITEILRQYFINHPQSIDKYTFLQNSAFTHWVKEKCSKMC